MYRMLRSRYCFTGIAAQVYREFIAACASCKAANLQEGTVYPLRHPRLTLE